MEAMQQIMLNAGVDPAFVYAYGKTGLLVTEDNISLLSEAELAEWNYATGEFKKARAAKERVL